MSKQKKPTENSVAINGHTVCEVEVIEDDGVLWDCKLCEKGKIIRMSHECARRHNTAGQTKLVAIFPDGELREKKPVDIGGPDG